MKRKLFLSMLTIFLFSVANGQGEEEKVFAKVEIEATTSPTAWAEHVRKYTGLPDSVLKEIPPGTYKVSVQFIIDKHGYIGQVKARNDPGYGLAKRAEKIILTYRGKWQPATQCGRNVNAYKVQPVTFIVPANNNQPNL